MCIYGIFRFQKKGNYPIQRKYKQLENMSPLMNPQQIQVFNGMAQLYRCFIKNFATIMAPIIKLTKKTKTFFWKEEN